MFYVSLILNNVKIHSRKTLKRVILENFVPPKFPDIWYIAIFKWCRADAQDATYQSYEIIRRPYNFQLYIHQSDNASCCSIWIEGTFH